MNLNVKLYENTGKIMEKYRVVPNDLKTGRGEYPAYDGFRWTNAVFLAWKKQKK